MESATAKINQWISFKMHLFNRDNKMFIFKQFMCIIRS
jgi:hypothetical protein